MDLDTWVAVVSAVIAVGAAGSAWWSARRSAQAEERSAAAAERSALSDEHIVEIERARRAEEVQDRAVKERPQVHIGAPQGLHWTLTAEAIHGVIGNAGPTAASIESATLSTPAGEVAIPFGAWKGHLKVAEEHKVKVAFPPGVAPDSRLGVTVVFGAADGSGQASRATFELLRNQTNAAGCPIWRSKPTGVAPL